MKNPSRTTCRLLSLLLLSVMATAAHALPITYLDLDFEDGTLGGSLGPSVLFPEPVNADSGGLLDGRGLFFDNTTPFGTQIRWTQGALPDSNFQYVAFDFYTEQGANVTQFLDVPAILRSDIRQVVGRHRAEFYYDFAAQSIVALLDGVIDPTLITSVAGWPAAGTTTMRIANQVESPGNTLGDFWVDNVLWQGDVAFVDMPEPTTLSLLILSLAGLGFGRRNRG